MKKNIHTIVMMILTAFLSVNTYGAVYTSTATGGSWAAGTTWIGGIAPSNTDDAIIATTAGNSVTIAIVTTVNNLTVNNNATLSVSNGLTVNGTFNIINGGTFSVTSAAGVKTFNGLTTVSGSFTSTVNETYQFNNDVLLNGGTVNGAATGIFDIGTALNPFNFTEQGTSALNAATMNVYGSVDIQGDLTVTSTSGNKIFKSDLTVENGASITNTAGETFTVSGNLVMNGGTLDGTATGTYNVTGSLNIASGNNTIGQTTLTISSTTNITGNLDVNNNAGNKTLKGDVTINNTGIWTNSGNESYTLDGNFTNNGTFSSGTGTYTFFGSAAQSIGGTSQIAFGNLTISNTTAAVTLGANIDMTGALNVKAGATLNLAAFSLGAASAPTGITIYCGATTGSTINGSGTLYLGGTVTVTNAGTGNNGAIIAPSIILGATRTFNVSSGGGNPDLTVNGVISDAMGGFGITKGQAGIMMLSALNTYTGKTTINNGILSINTIQAVNGGSSSIGAPATVANGTIDIAAAGTLKYTGTGHSSDRVIDLTGSGGTVDASGSGTLTLSGGVTGNGRNLILTGTGTGIESGVINTTTGAVTKNLTGTWTLSGINTFRGGATLNGGTLNINNISALGTIAGTFTINGGAIDNTSGGITTVNYPLALNGDFTFNGTNLLNLGNGNVSLSGDRQITTTASTLTIGGAFSAIAPYYSLTKLGNGMLSFGASDVYLNNVTISAGTLTSTTGTMNIAGDFTNNSTFTPNSGAVNFNGSTVSQTIGGTNTTTFYDLIFDNTFATSPEIVLGINLNVNDNLNMTAGNVDLSTFSLTLGVSAANPGTLSYTGGWLYGGSFPRYYNTAAIADRNVAGMFPMGTSLQIRPFYITPSVALTIGGSITLTHTGALTASVVNFPDGASTVISEQNSFWTCSTSGLVDGTYDLSGEGTGFGVINNVADLRMTLIGSVVGTAGVNGGTNADPQVNRTGLTLAQLANDFYISSVNASSSLPIELLYFKATCENNSTKLNWATASETNNDYFSAEKSQDGLTFENINNIPGAGNSNTTLYYSATDEKPFSGITYYRLKQTDYNGNYTYSDIVSASCSQDSHISMLISQSENGVNLYITPNDNKILTLSIFDISGRLAYNKNISTISTESPLTISPVFFNAGIYLFRLQSETENIIQKVLIK